MRRFSLELDAAAVRADDPASLLDPLVVLFPGLQQRRGPILTILTELYTNAVDHGLLGLASDLKTSGREGFDRYYEERERRLRELRSAALRIDVELRTLAIGGRLDIRVEDTGPGFDHRAYRREGAGSRRRHGRGLGLLSVLCREVRFNARGNCVHAVYQWP